MYKIYENQLATPCTEQFGTKWILLENSLLVSSWILAGVILWPIRIGGAELLTYAWTAYVIGVQLILKKHVCSGCYYYGRSCHLGWGHLSAKLFQQGSGNPKVGQWLALTFYMLTPLAVLIAGITAGVMLTVGVFHWTVLGAFVALNLASGALRPHLCKQCAIRKVCSGSAAKNTKG